MIQAYMLAMLGVLAAQLTPGPNMLAIAEVGLGQGRRPALFVVLGIATGVLVWCAAAAFGLGLLFAAVPTFLTMLKLLGGAYLVFLGVRAFITGQANTMPNLHADVRGLSNQAAWWRGLSVAMMNPKAALMWSAVATLLFGAGLSTWQVLGFGPLAAVCALVIYGTYGLLFSTAAATAIYQKFFRLTQNLFGAAFAFLGGSLLVSGLMDLRR